MLDRSMGDASPFRATRRSVLQAASIIAAGLVLNGCTATDSATDGARGASCVRVPVSTLAMIKSGLLEGVDGSDATSHPSSVVAGVSFVAVKLRGSHIIPGDDVALFATFDDLASDPDDGIVMGVDQRAVDMSKWPDAATVNAQISVDDPAAAAARECLPVD